MPIGQVEEIDLEVSFAAPRYTIQGLCVASKGKVGKWALYEELMAPWRTEGY